MNKKLILPLIIGAGIGIYFLIKKMKPKQNVILEEALEETPKPTTPKKTTPKPTSTKKPIKYAIFNKGDKITPKIPNKIMYLYTRDNKFIGETKNAIVNKQIEASPEWLLVTAKVLSKGTFPILIDTPGYILTNTAMK
jgi:hypothetical protein